MESGQSRDPLGLCIERIMPPRKDPAVRLAGEGKSPISISFVNQFGSGGRAAEEGPALAGGTMERA